MTKEPMDPNGPSGAGAPMGTEPATDADFRYAPFPDLDEPLVERLGQFPRQPDISLEILRFIGRTIMVGLLRAQFRLEVHGAVPALPRVALIGNHQSHLDGLSVIAALSANRRGQVAVLAARDYFFERWQRAFAAALFGQAVAFDRQRPIELRRWARLLRASDRGTLLAFPSGSRRSRDIHAGLLSVLADCGWPIVPVAIVGTAEAWPVGRPLWRPFRRLGVTFGEPLAESDRADLVGALRAFWAVHGA